MIRVERGLCDRFLMTDFTLKCAWMRNQMQTRMVILLKLFLNNIVHNLSLWKTNSFKPSCIKSWRIHGLFSRKPLGLRILYACDGWHSQSITYTSHISEVASYQAGGLVKADLSFIFSTFGGELLVCPSKKRAQQNQDSCSCLCHHL